MTITFEIPFELEYRRNLAFTGRDYLLDALHDKISSSSKSTPVVLHGTGGIGKTEIALEYIYAHQKEFSSVFWVDATTRETTIRGFLAIAFRLLKQHAKIAHNSNPDYLLIAKNLDMVGAVDENGHISPEEENTQRVVQGVKLWFTKEENKNWLLVFDNLDDLEYGIQKFVPSAPHGTIIMTSRRPECAGFGVGLEVAIMQKTEGIVLLLKSARLENSPGGKLAISILQ